MSSTSRVFKNIYKDSIQLMVLSRTLEGQSGVLEASVMVWSPGNMEMMQARGLWDASMDEASASDVVLFVRAESADTADAAAALAERQLTASDLGTSESSGPAAFMPQTLGEGLQVAGSGDAAPNLALVSVPGPNATAEALKAFAAGLHVFMFSDNVSLEDEAELKQRAAQRSLMLMGPDCGTALLDGTPVGFCNRVRRGSIGLVGASGTGLQQVSSLVHTLGGGVSQMIGVGGRDLKEAVGGIMMLQAMQLLEKDAQTDTIVLVSKPPPDAVAQKILRAAGASSKRVVIHFVGKTVDWELCAPTLEDAALLAVGQPIVSDANATVSQDRKAQRHVHGIFSGGTFEAEAQAMLGSESTTLVDFGDDEYTRGKPHPMIDYSTRVAHLHKVVQADSKAIVLMDVVLGHGAHADPAGELLAPLKEIKRTHPDVVTILHVCGTSDDGLDSAVTRLRDTGAIVVATNAAACRLARDIARGVVDASGGAASGAQLSGKTTTSGHSGSSDVSTVFGGIRVVNIGVESFVPAVVESGAAVTKVQWRPPAGGSRPMGLMTAEMAPGSELGDFVAHANATALAKVQAAAPLLKGVTRAADVIPFLAKQKAILHAGPPIEWSKMCGPMQGAIMGACIFEGWASNEAEARRLCDSGEVAFAPCHNHSAVGPMAGIIAPSFPVWVVENDGVTAYSSFNEGLGKVLRFGAFGPEVIERLTWMRDTLGPSLSRSLAGREVDLFSIVARALSMGDECHNRNAAASSLLFRELAPVIARDDSANAPDVLDFINSNDHFFLNLSMAACKSALDAAANIKGSTLVTAMCRNGVEFGVRLSGSGDTWFTTASPIVEGLFFPGYSKADANPDLGDSSITETLGIGGVAMAAAPAITGFVGGNAASSLQITKDMYRIFMTRHQRMAIPSLDFAGVPFGLDALRVLETNEMPVINTGIAHKEAGVGQIGAGICRAPSAVFQAGVSHVWSSLVPSQYSTQFALRALRAIKK